MSGKEPMTIESETLGLDTMESIENEVNLLAGAHIVTSSTVAVKSFPTDWESLVRLGAVREYLEFIEGHLDRVKENMRLNSEWSL